MPLGLTLSFKGGMLDSIISSRVAVGVASVVSYSLQLHGL